MAERAFPFDEPQVLVVHWHAKVLARLHEELAPLAFANELDECLDLV